jgi:ubiquinol-cytochrome c reductase core subunit 2
VHFSNTRDSATDFDLANELHSLVEPVVHLKQAKLASNPLAIALEAAHAAAFHRGLGAALYPSEVGVLSGYLTEHGTAEYAKSAYSKSNIAVAVDGASQSTISKWVEQFFGSAPDAKSELPIQENASKYYGGEARVANAYGNAVVLGFSADPIGSIKPETAVLVALLGGSSSIKWSPGFTLFSKAGGDRGDVNISTVNRAYSDTGIVTIEISGAREGVASSVPRVLEALKNVAAKPLDKETLTKAIAKAKFDALTVNELCGNGLLYAGTSVLAGSEPFKVAEAIKSFESVTAAKVQAVSTRHLATRDLFELTLDSGRQGTTGWEGDVCRGWGPPWTSLC